MTSRARILLIDEDSSERAEVVLMIREILPDAEILEAANGLDYAQHLASGAITAAITAPRLSWGDGQRVLDSVKRRSPECVTMVLAGGAELGPSSAATGDMRHAALTRARLIELLVGAGSAVNEPDLGPSPPAESDNSATVVHPAGSRISDPPAELVPVLSPDMLRPLRDELAALRRHGYELADRDGLDARTKELVARFLRAAERLQVAMESGLGEQPSIAVTLERTPVRLSDAVLESMRALQPEIAACDARIQANSLPTLLADRHQLVQLFYELIDNAMKNRGDLAPRITIRATQVEDHWLLSVQDNGIGIPPAADTKGSSMLGTERADARGPRLGLAVCRHIVSSYDGTMWCQSTPGAGTTVFARLRVQALKPRAVALTVQCDGEVLGHVTVSDGASRNEILQAALAIPELVRKIHGRAIRDVQLAERNVVNIVL